MMKPSAEKPLWSQKIASYPVGLSLQNSTPNAAIMGIEGELYFFNVESGRMAKRLISHKGGNTVLASLDLTQEFVTGGEDGTIRIWGRESPKSVWEHSFSKDWVDALAVSNTGHFAAAAGRTLLVWNYARTLIFEQQFDQPVRQLQFIRNGQELVVSTPRKSAFLNIPAGEELYKVEYDASPFKALVSPDERWLAAGMSDMGVQLNNLRSLSTQALGIGHFSSKPKHTCWAPDSQLFAAGNGDRVYLIKRGVLEELAMDHQTSERDIRLAIRPLEYVTGKTTALQFHGTEPWLAVGTEEGNLVLEDLNSHLRLVDVFVQGGAIVELQWTADSDRLVYATESGIVGCFWFSGELLH
ncbi:MAG: WD40 repeat domain-containing protein [Sumerlaeia bacterium]